MEKKEKKQTQTKTAKAYLLTLNQPEHYEKVKNYLYGLESMNYFISTLEKAPETGHEHIHIYAQFTQGIKLSLKKLCGAHVDKCYGSPQQNLDYIHKVKEPEKRGTILDEWGDIKLKGGKTIKEVKQMTKEERDDLPIQYYKIIKEINLIEENDIVIDEIYKPELEVYYIWGPSEMDKTKNALKLAKKKGYEKINMVKYHNGFWLGIGTSKCCLYDDYRDTDMDPNEFINFIDYNIHVLNIKGGSVKNLYQLILITSVQDPQFIYEYKQVKEETAKQWLRRMTVIDITDNENLNKYFN